MKRRDELKGLGFDEKTKASVGDNWWEELYDKNMGKVKKKVLKKKKKIVKKKRKDSDHSEIADRVRVRRESINKIDASDDEYGDSDEELFKNFK